MYDYEVLVYQIAKLMYLLQLNLFLVQHLKQFKLT